MKCIIAKKIEMSQRFKDDGTVVPVTVLAIETCVVTQIKTTERDGYSAVQLGFGNKKKQSKVMAGQFKSSKASPKLVREFRTLTGDVFNIGDVISSDNFEVGDFVKVTGQSIGKGFQGVVKRHHFRGGPASHGHKDNLRMPGSIGSGGMQRVFKGVRMGGHMGARQVTISNLEVVEIDKEAKRLVIKGAVPGKTNSILLITSFGKNKLSWK